MVSQAKRDEKGKKFVKEIKKCGEKKSLGKEGFGKTILESKKKKLEIVCRQRPDEIAIVEIVRTCGLRFEHTALPRYSR